MYKQPFKLFVIFFIFLFTSISCQTPNVKEPKKEDKPQVIITDKKKELKSFSTKATVSHIEDFSSEEIFYFTYDREVHDRIAVIHLLQTGGADPNFYLLNENKVSSKENASGSIKYIPEEKKWLVNLFDRKFYLDNKGSYTYTYPSEEGGYYTQTYTFSLTVSDSKINIKISGNSVLSPAYSTGPYSFPMGCEGVDFSIHTGFCYNHYSTIQTDTYDSTIPINVRTSTLTLSVNPTKINDTNESSEIKVSSSDDTTWQLEITKEGSNTPIHTKSGSEKSYTYSFTNTEQGTYNVKAYYVNYPDKIETSTVQVIPSPTPTPSPSPSDPCYPGTTIAGQFDMNGNPSCCPEGAICTGGQDVTPSGNPSVDPSVSEPPIDISISPSSGSTATPDPNVTPTPPQPTPTVTSTPTPNITPTPSPSPSNLTVKYAISLDDNDRGNFDFRLAAVANSNTSYIGNIIDTVKDVAGTANKASKVSVARIIIDELVNPQSLAIADAQTVKDDSCGKTKYIKGVATIPALLGTSEYIYTPVLIDIHKGSALGTIVNTFPINISKSSDFAIKWTGKDKNGSYLEKGDYYITMSPTKYTDTRLGKFHSILPVTIHRIVDADCECSEKSFNGKSFSTKAAIGAFYGSSKNDYHGVRVRAFLLDEGQSEELGLIDIVHNSEVFKSGNEIEDRYILAQKYKTSPCGWEKVKGLVTISIDPYYSGNFTGDEIKTEVHWYNNKNAGKFFVESKVKMSSQKYYNITE